MRYPSERIDEKLGSYSKLQRQSNRATEENLTPFIFESKRVTTVPPAAVYQSRLFARRH